MRDEAIAIRLECGEFDPHAEAQAFAQRNPNAGAIVTFLGQVRSEKGSVRALCLQHYPGFTEQRIEEAARETCRRWPLDGVTIVHRTGRLAPGEAVVFVAAAAAHRRGAFEAVDYLMDYLKCDAPFWKREVSKKGEQWIEPRGGDYADKARWTLDKGEDS